MIDKPAVVAWFRSQLEQQLAANARARFDKDFDIRVTEKRLHERVRGFLAEKSKA